MISRTRTALVTVIVVGVAISIAAAAAIFSTATATEDVAEHGTTGILTEAALSAAAATHNAVGQSQLIAEATDLGVSSAADLDESIATAQEALAEFARRKSQLAAELTDDAARNQLTQRGESFNRAAETALAMIAAGDLSSSTAAATDLHSSYVVLVNLLAEGRNDAFSQISIAGDDAGRLADAARFVVVLLVPVTILVTYRNRIRRTQHRSRLEADLEKEQAVSRTKSDFIAHMSHQLRTPLTSIYGSALELNKPAITANIPLSRELTTMITQESAELARMVEDILTVAAEDQGQLSVDIQATDPVVEITGVLEPLETIGRKTHRELEPATIAADPRHFRQIISNLASNAHRYGADPVLICGTIRDNRYQIEVIDHGDGIDQATEERLFNRFVHEGDSPLITGRVGLGLSVAEILVTRMDGAIDYRRRNGTTVFSVHLPLAVT